MSIAVSAKGESMRAMKVLHTS